MKTSIYMAALAAALASTLAPALHAQETAPAAQSAVQPAVQPDISVSYNAGLVSDYRYRGISQTRLKPALQGGADVTQASTGLYAGAWLSTIRWTRDNGGSGGVEWDLYAGKRGQVGALSYDVGLLGYVYPDNGLGHVPGFANANTLEAYGQLGAGPVYAKYSVALTNLFGFVDSRHSGYLDLGANVPLADGLTLNLHAGRQTVRHAGQADYTDWKVGVTRDFGIVTGALAWVGTNANEAAYASPANGKFLGRGALVASVTKTF